KAKKVGDFTVELLEDFFQGFAQAARANGHPRCLSGRSSHHRIEALFKAFPRALRFAVSRDRRLKNVLPSTKELLRPPLPQSRLSIMARAMFPPSNALCKSLASTPA